MDVFPRRGQPAWPPHWLAIVSVRQLVEGLSDCQAADAVRGRIDWKLSEFQDRLVAEGLPRRVLDLLRDRLREVGLLVRSGGRRTDSTHVLAAVRWLNRLENTAEHLCSVLNALAAATGDSLPQPVPAD